MIILETPIQNVIAYWLFIWCVFCTVPEWFALSCCAL